MKYTIYKNMDLLKVIEVANAEEYGFRSMQIGHEMEIITHEGGEHVVIKGKIVNVSWAVVNGVESASIFLEG